MPTATSPTIGTASNTRPVNGTPKRHFAEIWRFFDCLHFDNGCLLTRAAEPVWVVLTALLSGKPEDTAAPTLLLDMAVTETRRTNGLLAEVLEALWEASMAA